MRLCVIPARGGSKRIPRKNIRSFRGLPMIVWSIKAAQSAGCFDEIVVSTDDNEIADLAASYGVKVPFLRPLRLADDYANTQDVMSHAIKSCLPSQTDVDNICCLYATAPFVQATDLNQALSLLESSRLGTFVFSATSFGFPIQRAIHIDLEGYSRAYDSVNINKRSQDLEELFHDAGMFYWASAATWCQSPNIFDAGRPLLLPHWRVQDIDTEDDWNRAELMHFAIERLMHS